MFDDGANKVLRMSVDVRLTSYQMTQRLLDAMEELAVVTEDTMGHVAKVMQALGSATYNLAAACVFSICGTHARTYTGRLPSN